MIQPHEYDEAPDLSDYDPADGLTEVAGVPVLRGRPPLGDKARRLISLRLDNETIEHFKSTGPGWQTRMWRLLSRNDEILAMIRQNVGLIESIEGTLVHVRSGELKVATEEVALSIARMERETDVAKEMNRSLRDQLVTEGVAQRVGRD